jgi:demethylmenaquinone methyltransferase/2-methoxy-6-polyprenyl-1,4-benzoquinol methylase
VTAREPLRASAAPDGGAIRSMFASIAPRYDFLNHFLSLSIDRYWRRQVVRLIRTFDPVAGNRCLDLCTGTGDLALDLRRRLGLETFASDFCHPMLVRCVEKASRGAAIRVAEADAQELPFPDASFRFVTVAFGLRNVERRSRALGEMHRVLEPGGVVAVLEFSRPVVPLIRELFQFYFHHILPRLGRWISGVEGAYSYLPDSVRRFPYQPELAAELEATGWSEVSYQNLSFGIAALHWGRKIV